MPANESSIAAMGVIERELAQASETLSHRAPYWAYLRVSSEEQKRRKTIEGQRNDVLAWAQQRGVRFDRLIEDNGQSGTSIVGRKNFCEVLEACEAGGVGTLVVTAPDRLTRAEEWSDRARIWNALRAHRTLLVMTGFCEIDPLGETADLLLGQAFTLAAMERRRMRQRSFRGKMRAAESSRLPQGKAPYGRKYDRQTGQWSLVDAQVAVYRRIFSMAIDGASTNEIPAALNREGVESPGGKGWFQSTVADLLRSPAALGSYTALGKTFSIPAVIDQQTFDAAASALDSRRRQHGPRLNHPRLLNRLMTCGGCGAGMHVKTCGKPANRQQAYVCGNAHPAHRSKPGFVRPECSRHNHNADAVERAVWETVTKILSDPELLKQAATLPGSDGLVRLNHELTDVDRELRALDRQKQNLLRLCRKGLASESDLERQLKEVGDLVRSAEQRRDHLRSQRDAAVAMNDATADLAERVKQLSTGVATAKLEDRRALVAALFPPRGGFGLRLFPDGRIEGTGTLPLPTEQPPSPTDPSSEGSRSSDQITSARRSPGCSSRRRRRSSPAARAPASPGRSRSEA